MNPEKDGLSTENEDFACTHSFPSLEGHGDYADVIEGFVGLLVRFDVADVLDDLHTLSYFSEYSVLVIEPWTWDDGNEELGAICIGTSVCHRQQVRFVMLETGMELILELASPDGLPASPCSSRVSCLDHELPDHPVEYVPIIIAVFRMNTKVFDCSRGFFDEELAVNVPHRRVDAASFEQSLLDRGFRRRQHILTRRTLVEYISFHD